MKSHSQSAFTLIEIMIVVAIIGLLAAIAVPSLQTAIEKSRLRACIINQQRIDASKVQWALEQKRPLTDIPEDDDLFGKGRYIDHKPDCPAGGNYGLKAVEEKCTCTIPKHAR